MLNKIAERPFLEILIPTYNRPKNAVAAIESVINSDNPLVSVFCHSNGYVEQIDRLAKENSRIRYGYFENNQGMVANFRKLIEDSDAEYILFLSDEDKINPVCLERLLIFLRAGDYSSVMSNVIHEDSTRYFYAGGLGASSLSATDVMKFFSIDPTYISGYCFNRKLIGPEILEQSFVRCSENVYPHLILRNKLLSFGNMGMFNCPLIIKGDEAKVGGDSHQHLDAATSGNTKSSPHGLSPASYGTEARMAQFFYLKAHLSDMLAKQSIFCRLYVKAYLLGAWLVVTNNARNVVDGEDKISYRDALEKVLGSHAGDKAHSDLSGLMYKAFFAIRSSGIRNVISRAFFFIIKSVKLVLCVVRFGFSNTFAFLYGRNKADHE